MCFYVRVYVPQYKTRSLLAARFRRSDSHATALGGVNNLQAALVDVNNLQAALVDVNNLQAALGGVNNLQAALADVTKLVAMGPSCKKVEKVILETL